MVYFQAEMALEPFRTVLAFKLTSQKIITNKSHLESDPIGKKKQFCLSHGISMVGFEILRQSKHF